MVSKDEFLKQIDHEAAAKRTTALQSISRAEAIEAAGAVVVARLAEVARGYSDAMQERGLPFEVTQTRSALLVRSGRRMLAIALNDEGLFTTVSQVEGDPVPAASQRPQMPEPVAPEAMSNAYFEKALQSFIRAALAAKR